MATAATARETSINVSTETAHYPVEIGSALLPQVADRLDALTHGRLSAGKVKPFVVTSPEILALWGEALLRGFPQRPPVLLVPAGEAHKRLATVERLAEELSAHGADRDAVLLAFGGGVLGDLTGFLAAIYMRGIRYVQVPTTLLAQVDSSVGGKTGVNLLAGKNLVGAFHHPLAVFADIDTLATLPARELRAGLQESIKAAVIRDRALFHYLDEYQAAVRQGDPEALRHVVAASVRIKAEVVGADEREHGLRMLLNFGHTLGHAIEAATGYTQLLHGEAVAWGMLAALGIAEHRNLVTTEDAQHLRAVLLAYGPLQPFTATAEPLVALTAKDKKHRGGLRSFVLPVGIGAAVVVHDVSEPELLHAAQSIIAEAKALPV